MKQVKKPRYFIFSGLKLLLHCLIIVTMLLFGYRIGETFALNHSETYLGIASISPSVEKGKVSKNPVIRLTFTEDLNKKSVNSYSFIIKRGIFKIPSKIMYDSRKKTVSLIPAEKLETGCLYQLSVNLDLISVNHHQLKEKFIRKFTVD